MPGPIVGRVSNKASDAQTKTNGRPVKIEVKQGDTVYSLAKKFGMKPEEFKKWVGLKTNNLKPGFSINLPNDTVPEGKGIFALAKKYNMSLEEFGKLNNLPKPYKDYTAKKGERFYVKNKSESEKSETPKQNADKTIEEQKKSKIKDKQKQVTPTPPKGEEKQKSSAGYTPEELATKIYDGSKKIAAVGKPDFDALINEINPNNVEKVLKAYTDEESLINTITSEIMSGKKAREDAVMHVYDALAKAKNTPASKREEFYNELHEQLYDSWGMASTKKLDTMIQEMLDSKSNGSPSINSQNYEGTAEERARKVKLYNGKVFTAGELRTGAIAGAKKDEGFSKVEKPYIVRPLPNVNDKGHIEAASEIHQPTNTNPDAPLKGKVVIVNAGHGGYNPSNGYFDAGTVLSVKNAEGKEMPIEEWRVAGSYSDELTQKLQAKGATVVVVSGPVKKGTGGMFETKYLENLLKGNRGSEEIKELFKNTDKSDMAFISIHVESVKNDPSEKACTVRANRDPGDQTLAQKVQQHVGRNIYGLKPDVETNNYYVTRAMGPEIPAVLVELGNIANKDVAASLLSSNDRDKYTTALADALEETLLKK